MILFIQAIHTAGVSLLYNKELLTKRKWHHTQVIKRLRQKVYQMGLLLDPNCNQELALVVEHNGCITNEVCNATCVQDNQAVANRQMVDVVTGVYQTMFTK